MKATPYQLEYIEELAKRFFGKKWRREVDGLCILNAEWKGWVYNGIEQLQNNEAGWLIIELENRCKSIGGVG
jgi:hypothetical protein